MAILHIRGVQADLYEQIRERARTERRSIGGEVILLLEQSLAAHPVEQRDPAYADFRRRADALRRQADEWYRARQMPVDPEAYAATLEGIMRRARETAERYGPFPDSVEVLRADRERDDRR